MNSKLLGKRIKYLRLTKLGISQEEFSRKIGIDRTYFCKLESGKKNPTLETLNKICDGLGMTLKEFFDFEIPKETEGN